MTADEYDIAVFEEAYQEYLDGGCKATPIENFWEELDEDELNKRSTHQY